MYQPGHGEAGEDAEAWKAVFALRRQSWRELWWSLAPSPRSAAAGCAASPLSASFFPFLCHPQPVPSQFAGTCSGCDPPLLPAWPQAPHNLDPGVQGPDSLQAHWAPESSSSTVTPGPRVAPSLPLLPAKSCKDAVATRAEVALQLASSGCSVSPKCGAAAQLR